MPHDQEGACRIVRPRRARVLRDMERSDCAMRELNAEDIVFVCGGGAGDIQVEVSTDKVGVSGSLSDFADAAVQYSKVAPLSGIGLIGLAIRVLS